MNLREAILAYPELPVVVTLLNYDDGEYWRGYEDPDAVIGEVFEHEDYMCDDVHGVPYTDREEVAEKLYDELEHDLSEEEFAEQILPQYESYWRKCILVEL